MNKHISKFVLALGFFVAGVISLNRVEDVSAGQVHLKVTPVSFEYDLDPGSSQNGTFIVSNKGDKTVYYNTKATPYYATDGKDGGIDVSYDKKSTHTQIADWVTFESPTGQIEPNSSIEVKFTINVPEDAPGGGQYAALMISNSDDSPKESDGISISEIANIGPVVYAKVSGDITTKGEILSHNVDGFRFEPPISASSTVHNSGNVHAEATYTLRVFPLFSSESIYNNEEKPASITVLPDSTRFYTVAWTTENGAPSLGIFKVESEVKIFDEVSKIEKTVIICPIWVLISVGVFIIALVFWIVFRVKSRKGETS